MSEACKSNEFHFDYVEEIKRTIGIIHYLGEHEDRLGDEPSFFLKRYRSETQKERELNQIDEQKENAMLRIEGIMERMGEKRVFDEVLSDIDTTPHPPIDISPRPPEYYSDRLARWISVLNSANEKEISQEGIDLIRKSFLSLVKSYLTVEGMYIFHQEDAYRWNDLDDERMCDPGGMRTVPLALMLGCYYGFWADSSRVASGKIDELIEEIRPLIHDTTADIAKKIENEMDESSSRLSDVDPLFMEKAFYIASIFASIRVAQGIYSHRSPELTQPAGVGVQPILDTVRVQLNHLARGLGEKDAAAMLDTLDSVNFFGRNVMPAPLESRVVAIFAMNDRASVDPKDFMPLKVIRGGRIPNSMGGIVHLHLEGNSYSETNELKRFLITKARQRKDSRSGSGGFKQVKVGESFLFVPDTMTSNPCPGKFEGLNKLIDGGKVALSITLEQHRKSRAWFCNRLMQ